MTEVLLACVQLLQHLNKMASSNLTGYAHFLFEIDLTILFANTDILYHQHCKIPLPSRG